MATQFQDETIYDGQDNVQGEGLRPTAPEIFWNRRQFLRGLGVGSLGARVLGVGALGISGGSFWGCSGSGPMYPEPPLLAGPFEDSGRKIPNTVARREMTARDVAAVHTNFYEFSPGKAGDLRGLVERWDTVPEAVEIDGACDRPGRFSVDDLKTFPLEQRLYHFRCVERWAMNVPWVGFPLWRLLEQAAPRPEARWFIFESAADPDAMPGLKKAPHYPWPYREALRRDEAEHDLAFLALGAYDRVLPKQHGAPLRLVLPWKYGYKGAKSIVRITCVEETPSTFWHEVSPHEYGLLSNVNPNIPHPRWSQELSFWLRDDPTWPTGVDTFPTALFNGYEDEVAHLYPDEPRTPQRLLKPGDIAR